MWRDRRVSGNRRGLRALTGAADATPGLVTGQIMADLFTLEEIGALAAFYASPVGRQVMTKLPGMAALQQPRIIGG